MTPLGQAPEMRLVQEGGEGPLARAGPGRAGCRFPRFLQLACTLAWGLPKT